MKVLYRCSCGPRSGWSIDGDGYYHAGGDMTGSEMAKAGLLEQNRLSGANRNTLIAGGIMANTAEIFNFPVPDAAQKEPRVADFDDGYTRIANELLEAVMLAGLTQHQLLVFLAVMRKTYGFNKKLDWVSNEQLSGLNGYYRTSVLLQKVFW